MFISTVQLTTYRTGNLTQLIHTLAICVTIHKQQSIDKPGKVANPARGQLNRESEHFPVPVRA